MNRDSLATSSEDMFTSVSHEVALPQTSTRGSTDTRCDDTLVARGKSRFFDVKARGSFDEDASVGSISPTSSDEDVSIFRTHSLLDDDDGDDAEGDTGPEASMTTTDISSGNRSVSNGGTQIRRPRQIFQSSTPAEFSSYELTRRSSAPSISAAHSWDGFVRHGTRLKTFVDGAMHKIRDSFGNENGGKRQNPSGDENTITEPPQQRRRLEKTEHASVLAQERTAEVIQLQRQLKDYEVQASAMKAANDALREESASIQQRLDRTTQALRVAGSNAQKARADADAAQATAASLAQTLDSLETVVTETKRASQVLHQEHQKITSTVSAMEGKLMQKESELTRAHKELKSLRVENEELEAAKKKWNDEQKRLKQSLDLQDQELQELKQLQQERDALEKARKVRAEKVEKELRETQEMLLAATSGQAQAEKIQKQLQETIVELRKSNEDIHAKMALQQSANCKETSRLSEALIKAEKEVQKMRIDAEAAEETMQRLKAEKESSEKQISELKNRALAAERRAKDLTNNSSLFTTPEVRASQRDPRTVSTASTTPSTSQSFILPPLSGSTTKSVPAATEKENSLCHSNVPRSSICSICSKPSYGLMKPCQCGNSKCTKKAHISCVNRIQPGPSVSHPGTPAPQLPIVLCSAIRSGDNEK